MLRSSHLTPTSSHLHMMLTRQVIWVPNVHYVYLKGKMEKELGVKGYSNHHTLLEEIIFISLTRERIKSFFFF